MPLDSGAIMTNNPRPLERTDTDGRKKREKRSSMFTSTPDVGPPALTCPACDTRLIYRHTVFSGVKPIERWDCYDCASCGPFEYRERTRALKPAT
jgi:hypothetical protein